MKKIYFPSINGLRFIAAFLVIIHYTEQYKSILGFQNYYDVGFIKNIGKLGVILFFVLSVFLITYLLLEEKVTKKGVSIKNFYLRRILRIWPLYYLIIFLGLFIYPQLDFLKYSFNSAQSEFLKYFLYIFILPNVALAASIKVPFISLTWSIGVEEQFYIIWPQMIKRIKLKGIRLYLYVLMVYLLIKFGLYFIEEKQGLLLIFEKFWNSFVISAMAIGGLFAQLYFDKNKSFLKVISHKTFQFLLYNTTIILLLLGVKIPIIHYEFYSFLFGLIILNLVQVDSSIINLEYKILNYLGKISYGIYMFHPICVFISIKYLYFDNSFTSNFVVYLSTIISTILVASVSYTFFEKYFIQRKKQFSTVLSGPLAKKQLNR